MAHLIEIKLGRNSSRRVGARIAIFGATAAIAFLPVVPAAWSDSSSAGAKRPPKPLLKVTARIRVSPATSAMTPVAVFFTPRVIPVGTVIIVTRNSDPDTMHQLSVNGVTSRWMGPDGGTSVMKVTFKRPGLYTATVTGGLVAEGESGGASLLKVIR